MIQRFDLRQHFWMACIALLAACEAASPTAPALPVSTQTREFVSPTAVFATATNPPIAVTTSASLPLSAPPDGLRMAYAIEGNLYFQEGSRLALQLTHTGNDWVLYFSEDGEKLFFLRGEEPTFDLYSINIDGSQEQVLLTNELLQTLDPAYSESTVFHSVKILPNTNFLLFGTQESQSNPPRWNNDLLRVDSETSEIKQLLPPGQLISFYGSPDGGFIAIDTSGEIDILDVEGKHIRENLLTYTPSKPTFLAPGLSWLPDSEGLIVILPVSTVYESSASGPSYTVWRYRVEDGMGVQVPLDVLPMEVYMATVSPDGNWALYNNNDQYAFYLGDLRTGATQLYQPDIFAFHYERGWSSDSTHFIYQGMGKSLFVGSVSGSPILIGDGEFLGWIDTSRYLYYEDTNVVMGDTAGQKEIILAEHEFFQVPTIFTFIMP